MTLKFLAVGTGRDGTVSLTKIMNDLFSLNGIHVEAAHEYLARECYESYCLYKETGDAGHLVGIRERIRECPYEAVVGNGYASLLPLFLEVYPDLAVIHLKRADREACILSHQKNSELFPDAYLYYAAAKGTMRRVAAFHEGEMTFEEWQSLSSHSRLGWFYDYTHRKIEQELANFPRHITIHTESLSDQTTLDALTQFVVQGDAKSPAPVRLNRHVYLAIDDFSESGMSYAQWLFGNLSAAAIEKDEVYLSEYVTNKFIALIGYQISDFIKHVAPAYSRRPREISDSLGRFESLLNERLREVNLLKADLQKHIDQSAAQDESALDR